MQSEAVDMRNVSCVCAFDSATIFHHSSIILWASKEITAIISLDKGEIFKLEDKILNLQVRCYVHVKIEMLKSDFPPQYVFIGMISKVNDLIKNVIIYDKWQN